MLPEYQLQVIDDRVDVDDDDQEADINEEEVSQEKGNLLRARMGGNDD